VTVVFRSVCVGIYYVFVASSYTLETVNANQGPVDQLIFSCW